MRRRRSILGLSAAAAALAVLACARADVQAPATQRPSQITLAPATDPATLAPSAAAFTPTASSSPTPDQPEPVLSPTLPPTPTLPAEAEPESIVYASQPGDTLRALAIRFGVLPADITSSSPLPVSADSLIDPDQLLVLPRRLGPTGPSERLIPDSEVVDSPHAADFDGSGVAAELDGYLNRYQEYLGNRWYDGADVIELAGRDNSFNPRLLMALLEYLSNWVTDPTRPTGDAWRYPLGRIDPQIPGLYRQLTWLSNALGEGYYGWRSGTLTELTFRDGSIVRLAPDLNAGTVAIQYLLAQYSSGREWAEALAPDGFVATYRKLFGDPWSFVHPLYEPGLAQPPMILPFLPGHVWAFSGGPHGAWEKDAAWAALDFSPPSVETGCAASSDWVVAASAGLVVRSGAGVVVLDLDGDGREQTGWVLLYLHIATQGRVANGAFLEQGDLIGHPSCEGGIASGTHVHIARKYNGEWILAAGALPFNLSGWVAEAGSNPYQGALVKGTQRVLACPCASQETRISR
ncbi:MAG: M23 family metallopeptidase [Anaerolineales bacterium]